MQRYLMIMIESFYSSALYREVGQKWRTAGSAGLFLLFALLICWLPGIYNTYGYQNSFAAVFNEDTDYRGMLTQLPRMTVVNGVLSIDQSSPYPIRDPISKQPLLIFDIHHDLKDLSAFPHGVIVNNNAIWVKSKDGTMTDYHLDPGQNFSADSKVLTRLYDLRWVWFGVVIFPALVFFSWIGNILYSLVLAVVTVLFAKMANTNLDYRSCIPLTQIAMTPVLILRTVLQFLNIEHPMLVVAYVILTVGYMGFAVMANRGVNELKVNED